MANMKKLHCLNYLHPMSAFFMWTMSFSTFLVECEPESCQVNH